MVATQMPGAGIRALLHNAAPLLRQRGPLQSRAADVHAVRLTPCSTGLLGVMPGCGSCAANMSSQRQRAAHCSHVPAVPCFLAGGCQLHVEQGGTGMVASELAACLLLHAMHSLSQFVHSIHNLTTLHMQFRPFPLRLSGHLQAALDGEAADAPLLLPAGDIAAMAPALRRVFRQSWKGGSRPTSKGGRGRKAAARISTPEAQHEPDMEAAPEVAAELPAADESMQQLQENLMTGGWWCAGHCGCLHAMVRGRFAVARQHEERTTAVNVMLLIAGDVLHLYCRKSRRETAHSVCVQVCASMTLAVHVLDPVRPATPMQCP